MIDIFKNHYKASLALATLFILGIAASLYTIYSLPAGLRLAHGYQPHFQNVYLLIGVTFLVGSTALSLALRYKKEVIIYRDRTAETSTTDQKETEQGKSTISLANLISGLNQVKDQQDILEVGLSTICKQLQAGQGAIYSAVDKDGKRLVELQRGYALNIGESTIISYEFGEGLIGQAAASGQSLYVDDVPDGYIKIVSGLGTASPKYLLIVPIKSDSHVKGVIEIASFTAISEDQRKFTEESAQLIADKISTKTS